MNNELINGWMLLFFGIFFEVAGTFCLKLSDGFSHLIASILCFTFFTAALTCIALSARTLDISIVYAVWSGSGVVMISLIGVFWFSEHLNLQQLLCIGLILAGVVGLHHYHHPVEEQSNNVHSLK